MIATEHTQPSVEGALCDSSYPKRRLTTVLFLAELRKVDGLQHRSEQCGEERIVE
jgi:hypothetical protein